MEEKPLLGLSLSSIPGEYGQPIPREIMLREIGFTGPFSRHSVGKALISPTLKTKAVHTMSTKNVLKKKNFKLPAGARTTFHMAFSPDGTKVASCHGDHNVYVSDIRTMVVEQTLSGHPRTPWCVVFHPTQNDILASGCLAGHVRVWDLNGGSELLICDSGTVIASLSFHPSVRLLAIATFNEIIFWDWALGPFPLARSSTGNPREKVRLVRFDRLGHNLVTGITNFPHPPGNEGENVGVRGRTDEPRSAFFRPNILSRTPHPTHGEGVPPPTLSPPPQPHMELPLGSGDVLVEGDPPIPMHDLEGAPDGLQLSVTEALTERQERFQASYRQLVTHYEDLVQHYQQFIRTRLGIREIPPVGTSDFVPDSEERSPDPATDNPPIDIILSENPSVAESETGRREGDSVVVDEEMPGPSHRPTVNETGNRRTSTQTESPTNNNSHLRSIQALEQNILEMQNLCSQARRDSSNFPVEPVHIQELRTIRRHLEVLQDQTRRLQSSIRQTLSSLARGGSGTGLDALGAGSRFSSILPTPEPLPGGDRDPPGINTVEDIIGRTIQNALGRNRGRMNRNGNERDPPLPPSIQQPRSISTANTNANHSHHIPMEIRNVSSHPHEHSRFCPYGDGNVGTRPLSRMRTLTDLGQRPRLNVWPTVETGQELRIRSFRSISERDAIMRRNGENGNLVMDRSTAEESGGRRDSAGFPSFGSWMGQGPPWMNNDLGVRVYLTVRQFNERITSLRNERDQLLAEREELLTRRARVTTALARAERAQAARDSDRPESWQRNFNSGVALVPSNVRQGSRQVGERRNAGNSTGTNPSGTHASNFSQRHRLNCLRIVGRDPPFELDGRFQRRTFLRLGDENVPVYTHLPTTEFNHQHLFVFPIGLFLEGSGWSTTSIAIYWPHQSREEEESLNEYRRTENLIPVSNGEEDGLLDGGRSRYRIDYDSTSLRIHVGPGFSLTFIQPGLTLLDPLTSIQHFQRPRENRGRVFLTHLAPFLDGIERIFGSRRRREGNPSTGGALIPLPSLTPPTLRLSTVLQPGPYSMNRAHHYSIRTRRVGDSSSVAPIGSNEGDGDSMRNRAPPTRNVNVTLRREWLRDWERSVSVFRAPTTATQTVGTATSSDSDNAPNRNPDTLDWGIIRPLNTRDNSDQNNYGRVSSSREDESRSESASLASTRRVIRLAVATAASNVLRRSQDQLSRQGSLMSEYRSFSNPNSNRPIESRIERVLNERGNRGLDQATQEPDARNDPMWTRDEDDGRNSGPTQFPNGDPPQVGGVVVTSARPLRRSYSQMEGGDSDSESDDDESIPPRYPRMSQGIVPVRASPSGTWRPMRRLQTQEREPGGPVRRDGESGRSVPLPRYSSAARRVDLSGLSSPEGIGRRGREAPAAPTRWTPSLRRDGRSPMNSVDEPHYYRRRMTPMRDFVSGPVGMSGWDEGPVGARFYPGYIPEIVITPRARPPNYYTLDASTTAFLSSRIQKWDFSSFQVPNLESREEGVVVRECSLHSDACLDLSQDGDFMAVCIPSDSGSYSAVGIYSIRDESLGDVIHMFHFEQNTVSVSISPSSDYILVGYAGRGGSLYRLVHQSRTIGQVVLTYQKVGKILSLTRDGEGGAKLVSVKELFADNQSTLMSVNCMHWVPISGYGIIYGTNTGELVLLA